MIDFKDVCLKKKGKCMCEVFKEGLSACMWLKVECYEVVLDGKDTESSKEKGEEMKSPAGGKKRGLRVDPFFF